MKKLRLIMASLATALFGTLVMPLAFAHAATPTTFDFTADNIANKWGAERIFPTGGVNYVANYQGRTNVVQIGINSSQANDETYYRTEGIKTSKGLADNFDTPGNFGKSVQVDLYLDAAWENNAVRAGLWTVGDNGNNGTDAATYPFGIIEFANVTGYKGFRVWSDVNGWNNVSGFTGFGKWVTFRITLNPDADQYVYSINGKQVGAAPSPTVSSYLYSVILNQRNFGKDEQTDLNEDSYNVHWNGGLNTLSDKEACKNNGWTSSTSPVFKNQGDCVSYFAKVKTTNTTLNSNNMDGINIPTVAGNKYKITVSGTWTNRGGEVVDAECTSWQGGEWMNAVSGGYSPDLLDVQINNAFVDWGACDADTHTYTQWVTGDGNPINLRVFDGDTASKTQYPEWFGDNNGTLNVSVMAHPKN